MNSDYPTSADPTEEGGSNPPLEWIAEPTELDSVGGVSGDSSELAKVFDAFLIKVRAGESPDPQQLIDENPTLADKLKVCLEVLHLSDHLAVSPGRADAGLGTPARLGDFRILRSIGRGGMGIVYEAEQASLARRVALKVLPIVSALDPKHLQRFQIEARAAAQLHHPHIVPVFAIGSDRGIHYYAMQLIDGRTLAQWITSARHERKKEDSSSSNPGSQPDFFRFAANLGLQAAEALDHSHARGVLHRDIKPANLLIDAKENLWVSDFGLARLKDGGDLTRTHETPGTMRYMSPERVLGRGDIDERIDIYGLGATLYELLLLRPAYDGHDTQELLRQIAQDEPVPLRRVSPNIPVDLETIVHKAMARNPADRYLSARELAEDLRRFLEGDAIKARRPHPLKKAERWAVRHRVAMMLGVPLIVLAAIVSALILGNRSLSRQAAERLRLARYEEDVSSAAQFLQRNDLSQAVSLLSHHRDASGSDDLRSFPWYLLWNRCHPRASMRVMEGHKGEARHVLFSPDRRTLASCGLDGTFRLWEFETGRLIRTVQAQDGEVNDMSFSPDGSLLATVGGDGEIKIWNVSDGSLRTTLEKQVEWVTAVVFSGPEELITGRRDGLVQFWNLKTGKAEKKLYEIVTNLEGLSLSPDGKTLVAAVRSGPAFAWDVKSSEMIFRLDPGSVGNAFPGRTSYVRKLPNNDDDPKAIRSSTFSHDSKTIAVACADGLIRLWDVEKRALKGELRGHVHEALGVTFSPDDRVLASCGTDGLVRLWDPQDGTQLDEFQTDVWKIGSIEFSFDGRLLATANFDGKIQLWNPSASGYRVALNKPPAGTIPMGFSAHGDILTLNRWDGALTTWSRDSGRELKTDHIPPPGIQAFPVTTPDGKFLVVLDNKRDLTVWEIGEDPPRVAYRLSESHKKDIAQTGYLTAVGLAPNAANIALVQPRKGVVLWNPKSDEIRRSPSAQTGFVTFSYDGRFLIATENTRPIRWDLETGAITRTDDPGHRPVPAPINSLAISPDNRIVVTGGYDQIIKVWDAKTLKLLSNLVGHRGNVCALAFSPDGRTLASGGGDHVVKLWSIRSGQEILTLEGHTDNVCSLRFSPDNTLLLSRSVDFSDRPEEIFLWLAPRDQRGAKAKLASSSPP